MAPILPGRGWLWWGSAEPSVLQDKRDQVLAFLEKELDGPEIAAQIDEVQISVRCRQVWFGWG
jgi:hypothetical protein